MFQSQPGPATRTVTVGRRAGYYDRAGVTRDMFQNHLLQLAMITAMGSGADARQIGFGDTQYFLNMLRCNSEAGCRAAGRRARGSNEWIGAVIDVQ